MKTLHCTLLAVAGVAIGYVSEAGTRRCVLPAEGLPSSEETIASAWKGGNDSFPCYTSVAEAVRNSESGDVIVLAPGTHNITETINVDKENLQIRNASWGNLYTPVTRESVVLNGNGLVPLMMATMKSVKISDLTFLNGYTNAVDGASAICFPNSKSDLAISNCVFRGNNSAGSCVKVNASARLKIMDCVFSNNVQTAGTGKSQGVALNITSGSSWDVAYYGTIWNCTFKDNTATAPQVQGGVVCVSNGRIRMEGCSFVSNTVSQTGTSALHGHMLCAGANATIVNCTFTGAIPANDNHYAYGSALNLQGDGCVVSNCTFAAIEENQSGKSKYGMIYTKGNSTKLIDCRVTDNTIYSTAILFVENAGDVLVRNCLFARNSRENVSARMIRLSGASVSSAIGIMVENCTFADNTDTIAPIQFQDIAYDNYLVNSVFTTDDILNTDLTTASVLASNCCFTALQSVGGLSFGGRCIAVTRGSHKFIDAANGDYHLEMRSPLREKGMMLDWMTTDAKDLDGNPRVVSRFSIPLCEDPFAMPDIGCYECMIRVPAFMIIVR
ncbi:MAG: hypothetical protein K6G94_07405 [Kiritimatiellae bacterium]|nr:hypothetical protein [Kiritimatiellia bacterium]